MKRPSSITLRFARPVARFCVFILSVFILPASVLAQDSLLKSRSSSFPVVRSSVLPAEEAFPLNTLVEAPDTLVLFWDIKDNYYLYKKSISIMDKRGQPVLTGELPESEMINDEFFGEVNVYFGKLFLRFPLSALAMKDNSLAFTVQYQGCAKDLYCYPMQRVEVELELPE